jgi:hypothetical protein
MDCKKVAIMPALVAGIRVMAGLVPPGHGTASIRVVSGPKVIGGDGLVDLLAAYRIE